MQKRLMPTVEKQAKQVKVTSKRGKRCHFCDNSITHNSKSGCSRYLIHKPNICSGEQVLALTSQLGLPTRHKIKECPEIVANQLKERETNQECIPWPKGAKHLKLRVAYYDCEVLQRLCRIALTI